jgi:hypothetical protein
LQQQVARLARAIFSYGDFMCAAMFNRKGHVRMAALSFFAIDELDMAASLRMTGHRLLAELLFWSITLVLLLEDDVAMLAMMLT